MRKRRSQKSSTDYRRDRAIARDEFAIEMARCTYYKDKNLPDCRVPLGDDVCSSYAKVYNSSYNSFGYNSSAF